MRRRLAGEAAILAASALLAAASLLLLYATAKPLVVLRGSLRGYVSLVGYSVEGPEGAVESLIWDYTSHVSIVVMLASMIALTFSAYALASLFRPGWFKVAAAGLYASSLVVMVGHVTARGLAVLALRELGHIRISTIKTTAGLIVFPPTETVYTAAYRILFGRLEEALVTASLALSSYLIYLAITGGASGSEVISPTPPSS